jgi:cytochrome c oxidase cbb3-type subunit 3
MIFSLIYLILYPGLGSNPGLLNWSQGSRVAESYEEFEARFDEARTTIAQTSLSELQNDSELMLTADRIFQRECAACHGVDGRGQASLFPNLMDINWQWGSSAEQIEQSIRAGRTAGMISWQAILGDESIAQIADYVLKLGEQESASHPAKVAYDQNCAACHGSDGSGNQLLGAPSLADDTWLYGDELESVVISIAEGRSGEMPAFGQRLDNMQIKLLVALLIR